MSDLHVRLLRATARRARERLSVHRATTPAPATEQQADDGRRLERAATAADAQLSETQERRRRPVPREQSIAEFEALATHARQRLALYRRKIYLGRGQATRLAELERISKGAHDRARRARNTKKSGEAGGK